jgi:ethylmalonyl-CoA mutase
VAARDAGMEVVYSGIRLTPEQIAASARDEDPDVVGLSILSGSHLALVPEIIERLRAEGVDAAVVVGGIIPEEDRPRLLAGGVAAVFTPKDYELAKIMREIADLAVTRRG